MTSSSIARTAKKLPPENANTENHCRQRMSTVESMKKHQTHRLQTNQTTQINRDAGRCYCCVGLRGFASCFASSLAIASHPQQVEFRMPEVSCTSMYYVFWDWTSSIEPACAKIDKGNFFREVCIPNFQVSSYRLNETFAWPAADGGGGGGGEPFPLPAALLMAWMPKTCNGTYPYYTNLPGADM